MVRLIALLLISLVLISCTNPGPINEKKVVPEENKKKEVKITNSTGEIIPEEISQVIESFFSLYYESLASLEEKDLTFLFNLSRGGSLENAYVNQATLTYLINYRKSQPRDLKIDKYFYEIEYLTVNNPDKDTIELQLHEHSKMNFNFTKDISSITSSVDHSFELSASSTGWKIEKHRKSEDVYNLIYDEYRERKKEKNSAAVQSKELLQAVTEDLLKQAELKTSARKAAREEYALNPEEFKHSKHRPDNGYQRDKSVQYAMKWVSPDKALRNPKWMSYDELGGNCNNYISQCLLAGGIPMDIYGPLESQWKWYSDTVSSKQAASGRSPAWTGVKEFYNYCLHNKGFGLVAETDANFYSGEKGDIIIYGTEKDWNHAVIITGMIRDEKGIPIDYLINSNTTDRISYPVSAYSYSNIKLIRVLGWNN